jgi:hypothetical protein
MNSAKPPRLAAWILQHFGPEFNQEALSGDLNEAFQQGRSKAWYWRQVVAAIRWGMLLRYLLASVFVAWWIAFDGSVPALVSRPAQILVFATVYFASLFAPGIKRGRLKVLLVLLLAAAAGLLYFYKPYPLGYWTFLWFLACNFVGERKTRRRVSHPVTIRELVYGDPDAERERLMEKLHLALLQETAPEKRQAYAEAIAALNKKLPAVKAVE